MTHKASVVSNDALERFLHEFRIHMDDRQQLLTRELEQFLCEFSQHLVVESAHGRFNILDVAGVGEDEVRHSSMLAWLMAPNAGHGCGTLFLHCFLEAAGLDEVRPTIQGCFVRTEFSVQESIIDILIGRAGDFLIYIENKTVSSEGDDQIDREYRDLLRLGSSLGVPVGRRYAVFLTPQGRKPVSGDARPWIPLSYRCLANCIAEKHAMIRNAKTVYLVDDLLATYKSWG